jgi:hypothetical protein
VVEIDKRAIGPECPAQLLAADELPTALHEQRQKAERFVLEDDADVPVEQLARVEIQPKRAEPDDVTQMSPAGD